MSKYADELGERIANGHPHISEFKEDGINSTETLKEQVAKLANSKETQCFTFMETGDQKSYREADIYYHAQSNTAIIDPRRPDQEATMFKPKNGEIWFNKKINETQDIEGRDIQLSHGIEELEQRKTKTLEQAPQQSPKPREQTKIPRPDLSTPKGRAAHLAQIKDKKMERSRGQEQNIGKAKTRDDDR